MKNGMVLLLGLLLCVSFVAAGVQVKFEEGVDFAKYRTYAWGKGTPAAKPQYQEWIVAAITRELEERGLRLTDEEPDLLVVSVAFATLDFVNRGNYVQLRNSTIGLITNDVVGTGTGHLLIDLVDATSDKIVWQAVAEKAFSEDISNPQKKIDKITKKMFRNYPPK
jgi:hypothetical protein